MIGTRINKKSDAASLHNTKEEEEKKNFFQRPSQYFFINSKKRNYFLSSGRESLEGVFMKKGGEDLGFREVDLNPHPSLSRREILPGMRMTRGSKR